jgi:hypothetical protein
MTKKESSQDPVDPPPAYQFNPDDLPDLASRLKGLKLDSSIENVGNFFHFYDNTRR